MNASKIRMPVDITMTLLSIILMGGAYLFPSDIIHEILGMALFLLWAVHITLNRRWYSSIFRGKYNARRIMQTVINCSILICVIFLMISGIILSNHVFTFLGIESGLGFARTAHLLASHWYFLFMSLHIGMHVQMIAGKMKVPRKGFSSIILRVIFILISLYGIYAFIIRGIWRYLILQQKFFFLDFERGYFLFALDYISIIILFATVIHYINKLLQKGA
ncbi:DUF4405 domain-containing protein [Treponema ruminis]|uniref:Flavinylation-associated cytochrome domain-containing protein n=1 Tax=Treponema ruminis TaxID=744515 RepID=A0A7W8LN43_9SPIR|nr:DUF4405 domain-containing protein [Treponema ruminis]MBB5227117.1 hypothetical protein [Treponema ruminis]